eukprot:1002594-Rhodomonas_salina.3
MPVVELTALPTSLSVHLGAFQHSFTWLSATASAPSPSMAAYQHTPAAINSSFASINCRNAPVNSSTASINSRNASINSSTTSINSRNASINSSTASINSSKGGQTWAGGSCWARLSGGRFTCPPRAQYRTPCALHNSSDAVPHTLCTTRWRSTAYIAQCRTHTLAHEHHTLAHEHHALAQYRKRGRCMKRGRWRKGDAYGMRGVYEGYEVHGAYEVYEVDGVYGMCEVHETRAPFRPGAVATQQACTRGPDLASPAARTPPC